MIKQLSYSQKADLFAMSALFFGICALPHFIAPLILLALIFSIRKAFSNSIDWSVGISLAPMLLLFAWYGFGLGWTEDMQNGMSVMERRLSLVLFPLIFILRGRDTEQFKSFYLWSFGIGAFVESILSLIKATDCFMSGGGRDCFFSSSFSYILHPSYHAFYDVFLIAVLLYVLMARAGEFSFSMKTFFLLSILWFTFIIVLLASKSGLICLVIVYFLAAWVWAWKKGKMKSAIIGFLGALMVFVGLISFSDVAKERFASALRVYFLEKEELFDQYRATTESTAVRRMIWHVGINKVKEARWIGHGTGDVNLILAEAYRESGMTGALHQELNAHNQFLQILLGLGIVGLIIFLAVFAIPFIGAWRRSNYLFLAFTILVFVNLMFESMFEVQAGIVFISLMHCFLYVNYGGQKNAQ